MNRRTLLIALCAVALIAALAAWLVLRAPTVAALAMQERPLERSLQFSARVASTSRVDVGATLTGRVGQVNVDQGARVRQGDILLRLETGELSAAVTQAQASVLQGQARLAGLTTTGRSAVQAGLVQAESVAAAAKKELERTRELVARGFLSAARMDEVQRGAAVAMAQRDAALAQQKANTDVGTDVIQAQAQLAQAQAGLEAAQARLAQATISAPMDARVLARAVEPGQIVQPGRALFTLALDGPVQLVGQVDERYLEQLQVGQLAGVRADAFAQQRFEARVLSIAPLVDAQRGAVEVKLGMTKDAPSFLREDMSLSVEVVTGQRTRALVVPASALRGERQQDKATLWRAMDGRVETRAVRLGLSTLDSVEIVEGLAVGDLVLLGAAPQPGSRVRADGQMGATQAAQRSPKTSAEDAGSAMGNAIGR